MSKDYQVFYQHLMQSEAVLDFANMDIKKLLPALRWAIAISEERINAIVDNSATADFENTVLALEHSSPEVDSISSIFFNWYHADSNEILDRQVADISAALSEYKNKIVLNDKLFVRIKSVYDRLDHFDGDDVDKRLLSETYLDFATNGALLNASDKEQLKQVNEELAKTGPEYSKHLLDDTNAFQYHVQDKECVAGIPDYVLAQSKSLAESQGLDGWVFTLQAPCYIPVMQFAESRDLRKVLFCARGRLSLDGAYSNRSLVKKIALLRKKKAKLLGFDSYAAFILSRRMARNPAVVSDFLDQLEMKYRTAAEREFSELQESATQMGCEKMHAWDVAYYSAKLKQSQLDFDDEVLRKYFRHDRVLNGIFSLAKKLYGLSFVYDETMKAYHDDVLCYRVFSESKTLISILYVDLYPRPGKNQGAWMTTWKTQHRKDGVNHHPVVSMVMNFTPRNDSGYAFFSYDEVETLFHEFGHALHACLSDVQYASLASPNVLWDFVELPSQFMENYLAEKQVLDLFAYHDETGEAMTDELIHKIRDRQRFQVGLHGLRQVSLARLDYAWHHSDINSDIDVDAFEESVLSKYRMLEKVEDTGMSCQFGHIFSGGYAAGYYSYKWAEVLDADAFAYFKDVGIFDVDLAKRFAQTILARGNTMPPDVLYRLFRNRDPNPDALFDRYSL